VCAVQLQSTTRRRVGNEQRRHHPPRRRLWRRVVLRDVTAHRTVWNISWQLRSTSHMTVQLNTWTILWEKHFLCPVLRWRAFMCITVLNEYRLIVHAVLRISMTWARSPVIKWINWSEQGLTSCSTLYRSLWKESCQSISWLVQNTKN